MAQSDTPGVLGCNEGLGAAAEARCCYMCDDGDGNCLFPYYGVAPHTHEAKPGGWMNTHIAPREQWGPNFREDPDSPGQGVYMRCPYCNRGEPEAPNVRGEPTKEAAQHDE